MQSPFFIYFDAHDDTGERLYGVKEILVKNQCLLSETNELSLNLNDKFRFNLVQSVRFKFEAFSCYIYGTVTVLQSK